MRQLPFIILMALTGTAAHAQTYWQQEVNYTMTVSLDDKTNSLDGFASIRYINHSPDTLRFIWFHLWPNAYKNDKTAFSDQLLENGNTAFYFSGDEGKGYINRLDFRVDGSTAETEDHPTHIDITRLLLPSPLAPGAGITITTPFHVKLPFNVSRGGHDGQSYQATQWFPKPAVYDRTGWHPMPYLDQGEFYSEFGSYDVSITTPSNYVIAATGKMAANQQESSFLRSRREYTWEPIITRTKNKSGQYKKNTRLFPDSDTDTKTIRFVEKNIHDFAFFLDKRFIVKQDSCLLPSGRTVEVNVYYTPAHAKQWTRAMEYAKRSLIYYSWKLGDYPYDVCSVVQGPESFGSGMEYPTITSIAPFENANELELTILHEIGHNWFYGALANNERSYPWMDEGLNSYYENEYAKERKIQLRSRDRAYFEQRAAEKRDQPISSAADSLTNANYGLIAYFQTSQWMKYLETVLGTEAFNKAMQAYYEKWKFRHPAPADFKASIEESTGRNLDSVFGYIHKRGLLPNQEKPRGISFIPNLNDPARFGSYPTKEGLLVMPSIGLNKYDKFSAGALITNYLRPAGGLQFLLAPQYAFGSKKFTGTGVLSYSIFPEQKYFRQVDLGLSGAIFSINSLEDEQGNKTFLRVRKIVPGIKLTKRESNPRSQQNTYLQFKSFILGEDQLGFYRDSIFTPVDTTVYTRFTATNESRVINQLKLVTENTRTLYPYKAELKIEQSKQFVRTAFTGNYFFNYSKGGGLDLRFFAGKFFYTGTKTTGKQFETSRYHLNLSGPNGSEDYTYSDYFAGRNEFEGATSQQVMMRDGAFKVRTELLADKVGKTDDWLMAMNFRTSIPDNVNPLSLLPFRIPLKIFADLGTYAESWKRGANTDRFLFDAGLEIPILKETVRIFIPVVYSGVFKDYYKQLPDQNTFLKRISFAIDLSNFDLRKFDPNAKF
ncbi:MAG: M1 family peptidase [Chitinophagaceae bacterium]|nr:MAG: M1 family peptidase [Chitinophagaceae bacterium]